MGSSLIVRPFRRPIAVSLTYRQPRFIINLERVHYAGQLRETGKGEEARRQFQAVVDRVNKGGKVYFRAQRDWCDVARKETAR